MKMQKKLVSGIRVLGFCALACSVSSQSLAEESRWYMGGNVGQSLAEIDKDEVNVALLRNGFTGTSAIDGDEHDVGYKIFGGYQFNPNYSIEAGYFDLGEFGYTATTLPPGTVTAELEAKGFNIDLVGSYEFTEKLEIFARVGAHYTKTDVDFTDSGLAHVLIPHQDEHEVNYKFGLGFQYALSPSWDVRLEAERYRINDAVGNDGDIDVASIGLVYRFGQKPARAAYVPPKVIEPTPTAVAAPVIETEEYCTILDLEFAINEAGIQLEGMEKIGVLGTFMKKYPKTTAVIQGHTDDVGRAEDNQKLSVKRAQSVVDIMVKGYSIAPSRLSAVGYGASRPMYSNATQEGMRANRRVNAVISCATDIEGLTPAAARLTMAMEMEFDSDVAKVKPVYRDSLEVVAAYLKNHPEADATIQGHASTRNRVSAAESMKISKLRAQNVADYLVENFGVSRARLTTEGYGEEDRAAYNIDAAGEQDNQRVNIIFTYRR